MRSVALAVYLLTLASVVTAQSCVANDSSVVADGEYIRTDDCNTCTCLGGSFACSHVVCSRVPFDCPQSVSSAVHRRFASATDIVPGPGFITCTSSYFCECVGDLVTCISEPCDCVAPDDAVVYHNTTHQLDECNTCSCLHGNLTCTDYDCSQGCALGDGTTLQHGSSVRVDECNTCFCNDTTAHCTAVDCGRYSCPPLLVRTAASVDLSPVPDCALCSCEEDQLTCAGLSHCGSPCQVLDGSFISNGTGYHPNPCSDCVCVDGELQCVDTGRCSGEFCVMDNSIILYKETPLGYLHTDSCNTCRCTEGRVKCSYANCSTLCTSSRTHQLLSSERARAYTCTCRPDPYYAECWGVFIQCNSFNGSAVRHGATYRETDCVTCVCDDGDYSCTDSCRCTMPDGTTLRDWQSKMVDECNRCRCNRGELHCSAAQCEVVALALPCSGGVPQPVDGSPSPREACSSTSTCRCDSAITVCDSVACGQSQCVGEDGRFVADGTEYEDGCNTCRCTRNVAVCTNISCGYDCVDEDTGAVAKEGDLVISDCLECYCILGSLRWCSTPVPGCNSTGTPDTSSSGGNTAGEDDDDGGDSVAIAIGCTAGCVAVALIVGIAVSEGAHGGRPGCSIDTPAPGVRDANEETDDGGDASVAIAVGCSVAGVAVVAAVGAVVYHFRRPKLTPASPEQAEVQEPCNDKQLPPPP
ncbi:hypothetical protein DIPPA_06684 [Diplonema papillatum]|nr:hypothetical protein DIPPA_06684 [Diplonema papillatum]